MWRRLWPLPALALLAVIVAGCGGASAGGGNNGGNGTATARDKAVKFSECMRNNGVSGFPDPDASGRLTIDAVANGSSIDTNSAAFETALSACKNLEPPGFTGPKKVTPQLRTARLAFAQCVRDHGVPDFPDPTANGPLIDTRRIPSANTPAGMSALHVAMKICGNVARAAGVTRSR